MNTLSAGALLQCWECAHAEQPIRRSLALLTVAWPDVDARQWSALPIGARDGWLLALHEALFGAELETVAPCPRCAEALESSFGIDDIVAQAPEAVDATRLSCDGFELEWRLPSSDDLIHVQESAATADEAAWALLERCVTDARHGESLVAPRELPERVIERLQHDMERLDPGADTRVALECPACGHRFERRFDIGAYLWSALDDWAHRTLAEVHALATAYGWSEGEVLALSAARRRYYIALVQP
jgi:hypothetical protein